MFATQLEYRLVPAGGPGILFLLSKKFHIFPTTYRLLSEVARLGRWGSATERR